MRFKVGDKVEVFYQYSWKAGVIFDILGGQKEIKRNRKHWMLQKRYLVRLIGCLEDLVIDNSNIRTRRTWHDGKWILMGKSSRSSSRSGNDDIISKPSTSNCFRKMGPQHNTRPKNIRLTIQKSKNGSSIFEARNRRGRKLRVIEKVDENSDACSVGSCSITTQCLKTLNSHFLPMRTDDLGSDAESFNYGLGSRRKEVEEVSIRELELHAYRSTLGALYAFGPLSWEQEAMLTNLRILLHISNDEHLKELKCLISSKTICY
ncbi:hypothetical protein CASFOL_011058 [Castilleja foliolosa]|uniref:ENT domain-containing protein n=1 Tax=Castilleja foliolosa TaxID=1961234 RepID=A0ABD3DUD4_9LAMI